MKKQQKKHTKMQIKNYRNLIRMVKRGLIFLDKEDAISCAEVMIELLNGGYQEIEKPQKIEEKDFTAKRVYIPYP